MTFRYLSIGCLFCILVFFKLPLYHFAFDRDIEVCHNRVAVAGNSIIHPGNVKTETQKRVH